MEDKKIRISADLSQMRSLRDETLSLYRDLNRFSEEQNKLSDRAISQLREQLTLLKDRNDLEQLFGELKKKGNQIIPSTLRTSETPENEEFTHIKRNERNVEENVENSKRNISENVINIDRNIQNIQETTSSAERDINAEESQPNTKYREENRREISDTDNQNQHREIIGGFSNQEGLNNIGNKIVTAFDAQNLILRNFDRKFDIVNKSLKSIIEIVSSIDESIYERGTSDNVIPPIIPPIIPPTIPDSPLPSSNQPQSFTDNTDRERREVSENKTGLQRAGNIGTRIISGIGSTMGQSPVSMAGSLISGAGGIAGELIGMIPRIGGLLGGMTTAAANIYAGIFTASIEKAFDAQRKAVGYSQTMGVSNSQAMGVASREGSYAASALGINVGDYIQKRSELIRSAGGKQNISSTNESQSLMAVERLYGLNPQTTGQLQRTMRFSDEEGLRSSSSIIRIFEQTMKQLQLPFSEIASTIEESLSTFNSTADNILSKAGEFDAAKIASILASVRSYTGAEGRQLERYQQAFTGQSISQDQVTQAYLLRAVTQLDPSIKTHSQAKARIETIEDDPELMRVFVRTLSDMTTTQEQFTQVLKSAFTNLTYTDINNLLETGKKESGGDWRRSLEPLFKKIEENTGKISKQNEEANRYKADAAQKTVSTGESLSAGFDNKMIAEGLENVKKLEGILKAVESIDKFLTQESNNSVMKLLKDLISEKDPKIKQVNTAVTSLMPGILLESWLRSLIQKAKND